MYSTEAAQPTTDNILLAEWSGPYGGTPPWDRVRPDLFPEAIQRAIDAHRGEVAAIAGNPEAPSFANTIEALERGGRALDRVLTLFWTMNANMSSPAYQLLQKEWGPKLAAAFDEIYLDIALFDRIAAVHAARTTSGLDARQQRLVSQMYDDFARRGATLDDESKPLLSAINQELASLFATFNEKLLADEATVTIADEAEMAGVPADVKAAAAAEAERRGLRAGQYAIVNGRSAVEPVLTFADDRALRERVWRAFVSRGDNGDANDTNETVARIVKLRADRAKLLGFPSHAHWQMRDTMAATPDRAMALMMGMWPAAVARVRQEVADQEAMARALGDDIRIEPWDYRYYQEKVRKQRYDLAQDEIKPYFALENLIEGMMWAAGRLYGIAFREVTGSVPVFHADVRSFEVVDRDGATIGLYYLDTYARPGKRSGAWHSAYRTRSRLLGDEVVLNSNNNNFTKASPGEPVLVSLDDARTLFHEFGHAIHFLLIDVLYPGLTSTPRDFVEFPSQLNENWLLTRDLLDRFARHCDTGEAMPQPLIDKIQAAMKFGHGFSTVEYLACALADMKLHTLAEGEIDPDAFERETMAEIGLPREVVMRHRLPQFGHLFSGDGYSGGYYSYLWAEVMDADCWAAFEEAGSHWDPATALHLRETLLEIGNEIDPAAAYRSFRGHDPDVAALLRRRGFATAA